MNFLVQLIDHPDFNFITEDGLVRTEFWYDDEEIFHERPEDDDDEELEDGESRSRARHDVSYARLFTATSHLHELGKLLICTAVTACGMASQMNAVVAVLSRSSLWDMKWEFQDLPLAVVPALVFFKLCTWCVFPLVMAHRKLNSDPGDFVFSEDVFENCWTRLCLAAVLIFSAPKTLSEQIVTLHVRKPNQAVAIFKALNKRAFVVGWESREHYIAEDRSDQIGSHLAGVMFDVPIAAGFAYITSCDTGWTMTRVGTVGISCLTAALHLHALIQIMIARRRFHIWLTANSGFDVLTAALESGDDKTKFEVFTCQRLLSQYFGEAIPEEIKKEADKVKFKL